MKLERFCNNPACEECDLLLAPREVFKKGGREVCPKCLEALVVRAARRRVPLRKIPPTSHRLQESIE